MPGHQKVPTDVLLAAIHSWKGNVEATANELRISPKSLRERLARLGVSLKVVREASRGVPGVSCLPTPPGGIAGAGTVGVTEQKSSGRGYQAAVLRPNFAAMTNVAPAEVTPSEIQARRPIRIHPDHQEQLRQLKLDYAGRKRVETDETAILFAILAWAIPKFRAEQFGEDE